MLPHKLSLRNFTSYAQENVDLSSVRFAALVGANGAGKSSLLDALTWALFGEGTKGGPRALDNYVRRGEAEAAVAVEFTLHGALYRVLRSRNVARQRTTVTLLQQHGDRWIDVGGKSVAETQAAIERLLRMDYRVFTASSLILQGHADALTADMTDAERKDVVARILGLDLWERLLEAARPRQGAARDQVRALEIQLQAAETDAARADEIAGQITEIDTYLAQLTSAIVDLDGRADALRADAARKAALDDQDRMGRRELAALAGHEARYTDDLGRARAEQATLRRLATQKPQILAAEELVAALHPRVIAHEHAATQLLNATQVVERAKGELERLTGTVVRDASRLEAAIAQGREQSALLAQVPCVGTDLQPRCQLLARAHSAAEAMPTMQARLEALRRHPEVLGAERRVAAAVHARDAITYDRDAHDRDRQAYQQATSTAQLRPKLDATEQRLAELADVAAFAAAQLEQIADDRTRVSAELERLRAALEVSARATVELATVHRHLDEARRLEGQARETLGGLRQQRDAVAASEARAQALRTELQTAREHLFTWELLVDACGKKGGVPALIVETAVPEIERLANQLLDRLTGGRLRIRLDTQVETKQGTMAEALRIIVLDQGAERPYQTYSGAERFLVDLTLRVALSKFLAHRAGAEIKLLVLDEGIASADAPNRLAITAMLDELARDFDMVLIVTHLDELKDRFPQQIRVVRNGTGSHVEVRA
jgi:exonuclease SbcC